jgi:hypothetical protein
LFALPSWSGERSTGWNAAATGSFIGVTHSTTAEDMLQACMEGVAFRLRAVLERIMLVVRLFTGDASGGAGTAAGIKVLATGGALAASPLWCQVLANALECEVLLTEPSPPKRGERVVAGGEGAPAEAAAPSLELETTSLGALLLHRLSQPPVKALDTSAALPFSDVGPTLYSDSAISAGFQPDSDLLPLYQRARARHNALYELLSVFNAQQRI